MALVFISDFEFIDDENWTLGTEKSPKRKGVGANNAMSCWSRDTNSPLERA